MIAMLISGELRQGSLFTLIAQSLDFRYAEYLVRLGRAGRPPKNKHSQIVKEQERK